MTGKFLKKLPLKRAERHLYIYISKQIYCTRILKNVKSICRSHKNLIFFFEKEENECCGKEMKAHWCLVLCEDGQVQQTRAI